MEPATGFEPVTC